jgi:hypothetical protein
MYVEDQHAPLDELRPYVAIVAAVDQQIAAVATDPRLTPEGKRARLADVAPKAHAKIDAADAGAAAIEAAIARLETEALAPPQPDRERTADDRQAETFVWSKLAAMVPHEASLLYLDAMRRGDHQLIAQIDRCPDAFSPIRPELRAQARELRLAAAPQKATIDQLRMRLAARQHVASQARRFVDDMIGAIR